MRLFHIDRHKTLSEGKTISLFDDYSLNAPFGNEICVQVRTMYPQGISERGNKYLFLGENENWVSETTLENVRLINYPKSLSRFQCFFAVPELFLQQMMQRIGATKLNSQVFEVEASSYEIYDMSVIDDLKYGGAGTTHFHANRYWARNQSNAPLLECLLPLPVTIGRKILM